ncbi:MAG: hypothetical protein EAZ12_03060 [Sphingobacteriia bacterium]|nr:MAG: hypothetical protein EAZ12_03060 [Sphingobacteriia bacterium]
MKSVHFTARLALICNCLFLVCILIQRTHDFIHQKDISNMVIILGWMVAPFLNLVVNIWYGLLLLIKSTIRIPIWLALFNLIILMLQIYIYLILPA